jgi:TolB-like protein/DNA-binding SARP family transcriptional activator/Tfp pilus assembly protein PilF
MTLHAMRLRLLGRFGVIAVDGESRPVQLPTRKTGALLAYLGMSRDYTAGREELAALLWGDCSDQQARQSLRQALTLLRKELGPALLCTADAKVVRLDPSHWSIDARDFETLARSRHAEDLSRAARLFAGDFLSGFNIDEDAFEEWVNGQRTRLQRAAGQLCETFVKHPDLVIDADQALAAVEQLMALDPLREDWQRFAIVLYARYRSKNEALARGSAFAGLLQRELGVAPEKETRALVETIRASKVSLERNPIGIVTPQVASVPPAMIAPIVQPPSIEHPPEGPEDAAATPRRTRLWSARDAAAVLALGGVIALGVAGLSYTQLRPANLGKHAGVPAGVADLHRPAQVASSDDPWQPPAPTEPATSTQPSGITAILVLPFTSVDVPSERSTLSADLLTDDLTNALSRTSGFRVISRTTAMSYRGRQVDPATVGNELAVHYVLDGTVEAQDSGLRASVELIETKSRSRIWSARYDRAGSDRLMILDDIVKSLSRELQIKITHVEGALSSYDPDAHALIYKGFSAIADAGRLGQPALEKAEEYFTRALAREPANPRALTGLGMYHVQMAVNLYASDPAPHLAKAEAILLQVIEGHPGVGGPYRLMGVLNIARGRAEAAAQWLQREIEINPSDAPSYAQLGRTMTMRGHPAEGIKYILYAMRLSPRDQAMAFWLGMAGLAELEQGHDHKAIAYLERQLELKPGHARAFILLAAVHALSGNPDAARSRLDELRKALPHLSGEKLIERYFGDLEDNQLPRLREGLRLALAATLDRRQATRFPSQSAADAALASASPLTPLLVLPFTTSSETGAVQSLADLMTDDLTNTLSRTTSLRVISRPAQSYQGKPVDIAALGAELQVRYVLEGSMHMHRDKLRVNVELVDPATRLPVWTSQIERDSADRRGVRDEIVRHLARVLQFEILPD